MFSWLVTYYIFLLFYCTTGITTPGNSTNTKSCSSSEYKCLSGACIPLSSKCDGIKNCLHDDDETDCQGPCPDERQFRCGSGKCIPNSWKCDNSPDCEDKSDEVDCNLVIEEDPCGKEQFRCPGAWCIPEHWLCDGDSNCLDGEDESVELCSSRPTEKPQACNANQYECAPGDCIEKRWVCDGSVDCTANENDEGEQCGTYKDPCLLDEGYFSCGNNSDHKCLSTEFVCDGIPQCPEENDEGGECNKSCNTITCDHNCTQTPQGPKCYCPPGFSLAKNGKDCEDLDECQVYGTCSQQCTNKEGGFDCSCLVGYELVNSTCFATGVDPTIFVSTKTSVRSYNLRTKSGKFIIPHRDNVIGVAYDAMEDRVYWTDVKMKQEQIESVSSEGSGGVKVHLSSGLDIPEDITIDQASRNIYFSDSGKGHIAVCDMSGTDCKVLLKSNEESKIRNLAMHERTKVLFYSDWGSNPKIGCLGFDGSDKKDVITTDLVWPNGVAVDQVDDRLFWSDAKLDRLESSNLDGSDRMEVLKDLLTLHPFSLAVFEDTLYWSDWTGDMLASCNKFTGKDKKVLIREGGLSIMGITIFHPLMRVGIYNPCAGHPCSHLCLPKPNSNLEGSRYSNSKQYTCACPDGMELERDGQTCLKPHFDSLVISVEGRIYRVEPHTIGTTSFNLIRGLPGEIVNMQGDLVNGNLMVKNDFALFEVDVHDNTNNMLTQDVDTQQFAYDALSRNVYWIDFKRKSVRVQSLDTKSSKPILENLSNPKLLVFCDQIEKLVYLDGVKLVSVDSDGKRETVLSERVDPTVNILYYAHQNNSLVLGNTMRNSVNVYNLNTREYSLTVYGIQNLFDLVVFDGYLFWTQLRSAELYWIKFEKGVSLRSLAWTSISDISGTYDAVKVAVSSNKSSDFSELAQPCLTAGCSHLCFTKDYVKAECSCEFGHVLDSDGKSCKEGCASNLFSCETDGIDMCIEPSMVCDGNEDCPNAFDEKNCTQICDLNTHYRCGNGECLAGTDHHCDYDWDCQDGSDEQDCPVLNCEKAGYRLCADGKKCILDEFVCDGFNDCKDGSDELNCTYACPQNFFKCSANSGCYKEIWKCDGRTDCPNGEDEEDCPNYSTCDPDMYTCSNGQCLQYSMVCDKQADCEDGGDELPSLCKVDPDMDDNTPICEEGFACDDLCLPATARCNGTSECTDASDELNCPNICTDTNNYFQCKDLKSCITKNWLCDGENDCVDGTDEQECTEDDDIDTRCHPDQYRCSNGECLSLGLVCDGYKHCSDASDENEKKCQVCEKNNGNCSQMCDPTPQGPVCSCFEGYEEVWENQHLTCVDINECLKPTSCPQQCSNSKGSYKCTCSQGFVPEKGGDYCRAEGNDLKLVYASRYSIKAVLPYKKGHQLLADFTAPVQCFAVDQQDQVIFASLPLQGVIMKVTVHGLMSDKPKMLTSEYAAPYLENVGRVSVMAYDWVTKNLYYATRDSNKIYVCTSNRLCSDIVEVRNNHISGLVVDPIRGRLFVSHFSKSFLIGGHDGEVSTYSLDGKHIKGQHKISGNKLSSPVGLTLDIFKQTVHWLDKSNGHVHVSDYDGKNLKLMTILTEYQTSLVNFENTLFWINSKSKKISSYNIKTQETSDALGNHVPEHSHSILAVQEQLQPRIMDPCSRANCDQICLQAAEGDFSCACAYGYKLNQTNASNCVQITKHASLIPVPTEPKPEENNGPQMTPITDDNTGLIAGLVIFFLLLLVAICLTFILIKHKKRVKPIDTIAFTNSSYNNNESRVSEKESQVVMRRGAIQSVDNPMFIDSPQTATPGSGRFGFLKFGNTGSGKEPFMSGSPSMDFRSIVTVSKEAPQSTPNLPTKQRFVSETISYDDVTDFTPYNNDKERLLD